jgi:hypothetical protein
MTDLSLQSLRPKTATASAYRDALALLRDERAAVRQRIADETERLPGLLLTSTNAAVRSAEQAIRDDELNLSRLDTLEVELSRKLTDAIAEEAAAAHGEKVREACAKIAAFNEWMATVYTEHAVAIAAGVELERLALRAIEGLRNPMTRTYAADLPPISRAFVRNDARTLASMTRLPAAKPGQPIVWP